MGDYNGGAGLIKGLSETVPLASGVLGYEAAKEQRRQEQQALELRMQQVKDASMAQQIQTNDKLSSILSDTLSITAARGQTQPGLLSGRVVGLKDIQNYGEQNTIDKLNTIYQMEGIQSEMDASKEQGEANEVGAWSNSFEQAASMAANMYIPNVGNSGSGLSKGSSLNGLDTSYAQSPYENLYEEDTNLNNLNLPDFSGLE